jgi:lipopolysaccharide transport system permease protein
VNALSHFFQKILIEFNKGYYLFLLDFSNRIRQTFLGFIWYLVKPIAMAIPFILVGSHFKMAEVGVPYPLFALCGLMVWGVFWDTANGVLYFSRRSRRMISFVDVSGFCMVSAAAINSFLHFAVLGLIVLGVLFYQGIELSLNWVLLLPLLLVAMLSGAAISLIFVPINLIFRDVQHGFGYLGQLLLWTAPILHQADQPGLLTTVYAMNPVTYLLVPVRDIFLGIDTGFSNPQSILITSVCVILFLFLSMRFYKRSMRVVSENVI